MLSVLCLLHCSLGWDAEGLSLSVLLLTFSMSFTSEATDGGGCVVVTLRYTLQAKIAFGFSFH